MGKKYELVAWTRNIADREKARLYVVPSLKLELEEQFIDEICKYREEEECYGAGLELAKRFVRVYEQAARFELLTGHIDQAIRLLFLAAAYCLYDDNDCLCYYDACPGSSWNTYYYVRGKLRYEFARLCEEAVSLVGKYGFEHILDEVTPNRIWEKYLDSIRYDKDFKQYLKEVSAWLKI